MFDETQADFPYSDTEAAKMLRNGLRVQKANGFSLRKLAGMLGYKQATVLSHMSSGRVAVPIKKAALIAEVVRLPFQPFLIAAAQQRHQNASGSTRNDVFRANLATVRDVSSLPPQEDAFAAELEAIAGQSLSELDSETKNLLREVVAQRHPARRWVSVAELPTVLLIRKLRPNFSGHGLLPADQTTIELALSA